MANVRACIEHVTLRGRKKNAFHKVLTTEDFINTVLRRFLQLENCCLLVILQNALTMILGAVKGLSHAREARAQIARKFPTLV